MSNMDIIVQFIVQWATILSPIIAVLIAWWTVWSSAKDTVKKISKFEESTREQIAALEESTKKQIAALEEATTKQIESVKELTRIQLELSIMQIEKEATETNAHYKQASKRYWDELERDRTFNQYGLAEDSWRQRDDRRRDLTDKKEYNSNHLQDLHCYLKRLDELKEKVGGE